MEAVRLKLPDSSSGRDVSYAQRPASSLSLPAAFHSASRLAPVASTSRPAPAAHKDDRPILKEPELAKLRSFVVSSAEQQQLDALDTTPLHNVPSGVVPSGSELESDLSHLLERIAAELRVPTAFEVHPEEREAEQELQADAFLLKSPKLLSLISALIPHLSSPSPAILLSVLAHSPFPTPFSYSDPLANSIALSLPRLPSILLELLTVTLPPFFSLHPRLSATSHRPISRPRGGESALLDRYNDEPPPLTSLAPVLGFIFQHLPRETLVPLLFSHILPPLLAYLDHFTPETKRIGGQLLLLLLPKLDVERVKSTGTDKLLLDALGPNLPVVIPFLDALYGRGDKVYFETVAKLVVFPSVDLSPPVVRSLPPAIRQRFFPLFVTTILGKAGQEGQLLLLRDLWREMLGGAEGNGAIALEQRRERWRGTVVAGLGKAWVEARNRDALHEEFRETLKLVLGEGEAKTKWETRLIELDAAVFGSLLKW